MNIDFNGSQDWTVSDKLFHRGLLFNFMKPVVEKHGWKVLSVFPLSGGTVKLWSAKNPAGGSKTVEY